jgi:cytochrome c oxidase subunit III
MSDRAKNFPTGKTPSTARTGLKGLAAFSPAPLKTSPVVWPTRRDIYRAKLAFYVFLASLGMFFAGSLASYIIIRAQAFQPIQREYQSLQLPAVFIFSTVLLVFVSGFLQWAVHCIRREQQSSFRTGLVLAWIAAAIFLACQAFGMESLFASHFVQDDGSTKVFGMCFTMALVHALHVLGGMVFLAFVIYQGFRNRYDHERNYAVEHCAAYWHFLDVVWLLMLGTFLVAQ